MMLWIAFFLLFALALTTLFLGLRGKRVNDHPICRKCKFDLVGVYAAENKATGATDVPPVVANDNSNRCPECGRDLSRKRSVRFGARRKRPFHLSTAAALLFLSIGIGGAWGWGRANTFNWNTIKPTWWLVIEADSADTAISGAALDELVLRAAKQELLRGTHERLVQRALTIQADPIANWHTSWGDLVEIAMSQDWLSDDDTLAYIKNVPGIMARVRSPVVHGGVTSLSFVFAPYRAGSGDHRAYQLLGEPLELRLNGEVVPHQTGYASFSPGRGTPSWAMSDVLPTTMPGDNTVDATMQLRLRRTARMGPGGAGIGISDIPPEPSETDSKPWTVTLSTTFTVLEPGESDVTLIAAPQHADAIRNSIRIDRAHIERTPEGDTVQISVMISQPPIDVAFQILARKGDVEVPLGLCHGGPNASMGTGGRATEVDIDLNGAQLIFRGSAAAARRSHTMREIWDGEIVIDDVVWEIEEPQDEW